MKWIKQRPQLPGWWKLLQVALGVAFFLYMAYGLITSGQPTTPQAAAGRDLGHGVSAPGPASNPVHPTAPAAASTPGTPATTGTAPADAGAPTAAGQPARTQASSVPDPAPAAGASNSGGTAPAAGGTVNLLDVAGAPVSVPATVADIARRAMLGAFDPTQLRTLPLADGFTPAVPAQTYPHPVAGPLTVASHSADTFTFTATVDPDGTQRFLTATQATVTLQNGAWVYTNAAG